MKLVSFTVEKYRSITNARKIRLNKITTLVGPNNEGKSNILRALVTAMNVLTRGRRKFIKNNKPITSFTNFRIYEWQTDFPIHLQEKFPEGSTSLILEFELNSKEITEFKREIKSKLNGTLPLRLDLNNTPNVKVTVSKKGKGAKALSNKSGLIADFIARRLDFELIPAIRTARAAEAVVNQLLEKELEKLEINTDYIDALRKIEEIQTPVLEKLSESIKKTLEKFLPNVDNVQVLIPQENRFRALRRSCEIIVDDGVPTKLEYKGDGVQSLAALGIMRHASDSETGIKNLVIAIEEPESHLHPLAIHEVRDVLNELSEKYQIVLTTHSPLFIDRMNIASNILVNNNKAKPAKKISEIREILGIRASDNLFNAQLVLIVEGEDDKICIESLLKYYSKDILHSINEGILVIDSLNGASNLSYKTGLYKTVLCNVHSFLDDDKAGHEAFEKARLEGLLNDADVNFSYCQGNRESEFEDLLNTDIYESLIFNRYRVSLQSPKFKQKGKWSDRIKEVFLHQGKNWDERLEKELKFLISELVKSNPEKALNSNKKDSFDSLVKTLEIRLKEISS